jgi:hypothetical protein
MPSYFAIGENFVLAVPILPNSSVKPWNPRAKGTNTVTQLLGQACKDKIA